MKKILFPYILLINSLLFAQTPPVSKPVIPVVKGEKTENLSDTIITKDPTDPSRDYWVIHNVRGIMIGQGPMMGPVKMACGENTTVLPA